MSVAPALAPAAPLTAVAGGRADLPPSMVERMTLILDAFDASGTTRLTLEEVATRTRLPRSTAHRILDQLVRLSWLEHSTLGYGLGPRVFALAAGDRGHGDLRAAAAPLLHALALRTGMVVHLAVLDGAEVRYLDKIGGSPALVVPSRVGGLAPAYSTALGKAMLAWRAPEDVDELLGAGMGRLTHRTISDLALLHAELNRIRQRHGLAYERGECFPDIACAAVAVRGPQGPVGAVSLTGGLQAPLERFAPLVVDVARRISAELSPSARAGRGPRPVPVPASGTWSADTLHRLAAVGEHGDWL